METTTIIGIISALLAVSEGLSLIPGLKSNGIFQIVYYILKALVRGIQTKEV